MREKEWRLFISETGLYTVFICILGWPSFTSYLRFQGSTLCFLLHKSTQNGADDSGGTTKDQVECWKVQQCHLVCVSAGLPDRIQRGLISKQHLFATWRNSESTSYECPHGNFACSCAKPRLSSHLVAESVCSRQFAPCLPTPSVKLLEHLPSDI